MEAGSAVGIRIDFPTVDGTQAASKSILTADQNKALLIGVS